MDLSLLPFWWKVFFHYICVGFLIWIGYENPDATFLLMVIGWINYLMFFWRGWD